MASRFSQGLKTFGTDEPKPRSRVLPEPAPAPAQPGADAPAALRYMAPSRRGKKAVTGYFDPAVRQQLAVLAAEEDRSQNDLLAEAINMLFERYRKSPLAKG